jgi:hypothetical protein
MTPRQVVHQFFLETDGGTILNDPDQGFLSELTQQFFDELTKHGFAIVPQEATEKILDDGRREAEFTNARFDDEEMACLYRVMIQASQ